MTLDLAAVRRRFPSLARMVDGQPAVYADAPGGTQVPDTVIAAIGDYLRFSNANIGGDFVTSTETVALVAQTRAAAAAFLNAHSPECVVFGANMTSLTFAMSRAIAREWQAGDEIVVTSLDHDANVSPWLLAAEDRGAIVRVCPFDEATGTIKAAGLEQLLSPKTRLVALTHASNATGTILDLAPLVQAAHRVGALVYVDAVHYAPHGVIDMRALDCDFLACSAYKFFGPHVGLLAGKPEHLHRLRAYKVRPSSPVPPGKWETGTQNFAALTGLLAAFRYVAELDGGGISSQPTRDRLVAGMHRIEAHERHLSTRFLERVQAIDGVRIHGLTDPTRLAERTPTFALTSTRWTPQEAAKALGRQGIFTWAGHFYAIGLIQQLGLSDHGGVLRIGFAHYHSVAEIDRVARALSDLG